MYIQELIDVKSFLDNSGISYNTRGKNISGSGAWLGIPTCLWCGAPNNHLAINVNTKIVKCWKCGAKGKSLVKFVQLYFNCSPKEAIDKLSAFQNFSDADFQPYQKQTYSNSSLSLPEEATDLDQSHINYLISRNYDPDFLIKKYKIKGTSFLGKWAWRIIIPVYEQGRLVSFTSRDITNLSLERYKSCPASLEVINIKDCLYNRETAQAVGIVMEGAFDVWRIGDGGIGIFGTAYSTQQLMKLKGISRLFTLFDNEEQAQERARIFGHEASIYVPEVINIQIPYDDPALIPSSEIPALRRELFGKVY